MKKVTITQQQFVFQDFFKIEEAKLSYEQFNGEMSKEIRVLNFDRGDSVAALIWHVDKQKLLLINQFRYPTYQKGPGWILELVAGGLKTGEDPEKAILRELKEETGYHADKATFLTQFYVSPGGSSERILLYWIEVSEANKLSEQHGLAEENEDIDLVYLTVAEMQAGIADGSICDAKTLIAFLLKQSELVHL